MARFLLWWCHAFHPMPMRPVKGFYRCPQCLRQHPVPWEQPAKAVEERVADWSALEVEP